MTGIGDNTLAQPVKPPLRERRAYLANLVKNRLTLTADPAIPRAVDDGLYRLASSLDGSMAVAASASGCSLI